MSTDKQKKRFEKEWSKRPGVEEKRVRAEESNQKHRDKIYTENAKEDGVYKTPKGELIEIYEVEGKKYAKTESGTEIRLTSEGIPDKRQWKTGKLFKKGDLIAPMRHNPDRVYPKGAANPNYGKVLVSEKKRKLFLEKLKDRPYDIVSICREVGFSRQQYIRLMDHDADFALEALNIQEGIKDGIESMFLERAHDKKHPQGQLRAGKILMDAKAKDRGYGYQQQSGPTIIGKDMKVILNTDIKTGKEIKENLEDD